MGRTLVPVPTASAETLRLPLCPNPYCEWFGHNRIGSGAIAPLKRQSWPSARRMSPRKTACVPVLFGRGATAGNLLQQPSQTTMASDSSEALAALSPEVAADVLLVRKIATALGTVSDGTLSAAAVLLLLDRQRQPQS